VDGVDTRKASSWSGLVRRRGDLAVEADLRDHRLPAVFWGVLDLWLAGLMIPVE
jgi:hypothetical protein